MTEKPGELEETLRLAAALLGDRLEPQQIERPMDNNPESRRAYLDMISVYEGLMQLFGTQNTANVRFTSRSASARRA
jgi:hypothetical protein